MVVIPEMQNAQPVWIEYIEHQSQVMDVDSNIIKAICFCESSWQPDVGSDYVGLMQISNRCSYEYNLTDAIINIKKGIDMYSEALATYQSNVSALNYYNGRDVETWTSYSVWVMETAEKIYLSEKRAGYEPDL